MKVSDVYSRLRWIRNTLYGVLLVRAGRLFSLDAGAKLRLRDRKISLPPEKRSSLK